MRLVSRLRRIMAMMIVLLGLLAGLGIASAQDDAPILDRQTPSVAEGASATLPGSATGTPLSSPSPIQAATPLSPTPSTPSSTTGTPDSAGSATAKSADKTEDQASHMVRFDPADGSKPTQATVKTGTLAAAPQENPQRQGFRFDGWTHDGQPFDLQTPILQDTTLKAQWSKTTDWTLSPDHGPASGTVLTISPPDRQEPQFASIQAVGNQFIGLTGDGRLHAWTQEGTPKQAPAPVQAPEGFRYLQAAAGSHWQAALGSDQHIYTRTSQQSTPTILDTGQDTRFTSISINDDLLLAMDRQSRVHVFQASPSGSQDQAAKPAEQATLSLPGQAQAVTALASGSQALIVDADGQDWTWDVSNTGNAKPARIKQDPGTRTVQAQALNQGFLLLDTDGHARYLADGKNSPTAVSLPESMKADSITANDSQAVITDTDGHVWAWQPGETPTRADDGSQPYTQAVKAGSRITAISRQGSLYRWSLDGQDQLGKPARLDTTQAPTLESASMDSQPLKLNKNNDAWQADMPASKPGPTTILITGRQDGQPFTKNLNYTIDQTLTRNDQQDTTHQVTFNTAKGSRAPEPQQVSYPYGRVKRPSPDPVREGYLFDGWFIGEIAYDFSKPVTQNLTLTAKWTPKNRNNTWSISPSQGSQLGGNSTSITPPNTSRGIRFSQVSTSTYDGSTMYFSLAVGSDGNAYAWGDNTFGELGDGTNTHQYTPVMVRKPADAPADFTYMQVSGGSYQSLALGSDGNAYGWGDNSYGELGDGTYEQRRTPVKARKPADAPADFTYVQVSTGSRHSLALGSDGNVYAWGSNGSGRLGDGKYTSFNQNTPVKVKRPADAPADITYVQVSAGNLHSLAVGSDGNAYAWGDNGSGQLGDGTETKKNTPVKVKKPADAPADFTYTQVSTGGYHSLAVGSDGNAYAWGDNGSGQLGDGTETKKNTPVKVKKPADAPADFTYVQVNAGGYHSLAVGSDGYAYAWGDNTSGQLGNDGTSNLSSPVRVFASAQSTSSSGPWLKAVQVSCGANHSLAAGSDGNVHAWGGNTDGQLGNDSISRWSYSPVPVPPVFSQQPVITGVRFDTSSSTNLIPRYGNTVTVFAPAHVPGTITVSVDYTMGNAPQQPDTSLRYEYTPAGVLPKAGGEGILLTLATGMTGMGGVLASRRHRRETHSLSYASHE